MGELISGSRTAGYRDAAALTTPCFVIDVPELCDNIRSFRQAMEGRFKRSVLAYSVKTNALPYLLSLACAKGCWAEVVSGDEYELAKYVGFPVNRIVYNGPMKSRESFLEALAGGAYVNVETQREIDWLQEYQGPRDVRLGIRVNIDLGELSPEDAKEGEEQSRFGFDAANGELEKAIGRIRACGFAVKGLHVHRSSRTRSLNAYARICRFTMDLVRRLELELSYIDIGGGFYGKMPGKPGYDDYVNTIAQHLSFDWEKVDLILEPGNGLLASPLDFITAVIDRKTVGSSRILTCDGSRLDVDPFFHKQRYSYEILHAPGRERLDRQILAGCTCLENDVITTLENEAALEVGDRIRLRWQGAYTMALSPNFIRFLPQVYAFDGEEYVSVREKWQACNVCSRSSMEAMPGADGYLFLNAGRRATLLKDFKKSLGVSAKIISADNWCVAPALFTADRYYLTPKITAPDYLDHIFRICREEKVKAVTTCIDPEIELLAKNRERFLQQGVLPLCPDERTARLCFDKYEMFLFLKEKGIATVLTYDSLEHFEQGLARGEIAFPVFIKPRSGSGSVGAEKISSHEDLRERFREGRFDYIIQEMMDCEDCDADVYIDTISHKAVAAVLKRKIETRIGGASKTIAFKDQRLFDFIAEIVSCFQFNGPVDMDFFCRDGQYYLSEINPRFGGAYLHGFGAGVDFPRMIRNNIHGIENENEMGNYEEGSIMLMYDEVIMTGESSLKGDYRD